MNDHVPERRVHLQCAMLCGIVFDEAKLAKFVRIDGTTAGYAKQKMEAPGYSQIRDLRKGCDNYWHGRAFKEGLDINVLITPEGKVMTESS